MRKSREILRLKFETALSQRAIARACGVSNATVWDALRRFEAAGLAWPLPDGLGDAELEARLYRPKGSRAPDPREKEAGLMDLARVMTARARVSSDELAEQPGRYLMRLRGSRGGTKLFDEIGSERVTLVWSVWSGYWKRGYSPMHEWAARHGVEVHFVHSGGHAWL